MWKRTNKSMVGVDIGSSSVKAVELQGKNGDFELVSLGYESLEPDSVVDGQIMELNSVSNAISNMLSRSSVACRGRNLLRIARSSRFSKQSRTCSRWKSKRQWTSIARRLK